MSAGQSAGSHAESTPSRHGTPPVSFATACRFWLKLGCVSFGGPTGQIALMHRELVERRRWISEARFLHALNFCMLLPGPEAQQLATYMGYLLHRTWGGIVAGCFFVIPSIFVLLALSYVYAAYGHVAAVSGVLLGFKPVVVAIVAEAVLRLGRRALRTRAHFGIAIAAFAALRFARVPFPVVVLAAGVLGFIGASWWREARPDARDLDEPLELPAHLRPSTPRLLRTIAAGLALWSLPYVMLIAWHGSGSLHAREYRFFTLAAFVTFGGAYAVLAYVGQMAAGAYGWLTHAQMQDGLALAETTPGPLIMVLQFVGFMAGWNQPGAASRASSALTGALVATWATFLPSIVFILIGAPYVERLRHEARLVVALACVTAAVVGVILNLALVFATATLWPRGTAGGVDLVALGMAVVAFAGLARWKPDVVWVVLGGGALGLVRGWLGR